MTLKFITKEKRDELAERLLTLAQYMQSSFDQGHDGRIRVTDEMIGDIKTAACVVALSEIAVDNTTTLDRFNQITPNQAGS
jgi:hypothetical protein